MLHGPEAKTFGSSQALKMRVLEGVDWGRAIREFKADFGGVGKFGHAHQWVYEWQDQA